MGQPSIAPSRLRHGAEKLFGREKELRFLNGAWRAAVSDKMPRARIITFVAWGGVGKTALIVAWVNRLNGKCWPGVERYFDWSFYSQGTREQGNAAADNFIAEALKFFGDEALANSPASPWDKGTRLAQLVAERRTLLILDGLEPLQYPPGPLGGQLKDPAVESLLRGLAQCNPGLCVVTTREPVTDLAPFHKTTAPEWALEHLSDEAGAALLHQAGVRRAGAAEINAGDAELRIASREVGGHALALRLLGVFLTRAHRGDIRRRDRVEFDAADAKTQGGHAFKTMSAYERWLSQGGNDGACQLAILRLLGLFDRPADAGCLTALRQAPVIAGLTEPLVGLGEDDWNLAISNLTDCGLVSVLGPSSPDPGSRTRGPALDAHPLIREFFAKRLRTSEEYPSAWRTAHDRLYGHLTSTTKDNPRPTLEDLQPLYQAVAHGCQAEQHRRAFADVYWRRIQQGKRFFPGYQLGAFSTELATARFFFDGPWTRPVPSLSGTDQARLLQHAGYCLRSLGRLQEALKALRVCATLRETAHDWAAAAVSARTLGFVEMLLGNAAGALVEAERATRLAEKAGDVYEAIIERATMGEFLHLLGRSDDALEAFREAESRQATYMPECPLLIMWQGFAYCDLLMLEAERFAWQVTLNRTTRVGSQRLRELCRDVELRANCMFRLTGDADKGLIFVALDHLTLGHAALCRAILADSAPEQAEVLVTAREAMTDAVNSLRHAAQQADLAWGLLDRAWLRAFEGDLTDAEVDLNESWQIATRGPMRLHMADIHLHRARLFFRQKPYPWDSPQADLAAARKLIDECGYHRRDEELADAEQAIGSG